MGKSEIIFFDDLGFGWVVEPSIVNKIDLACKDKEDVFIERTLADLLRRV